MSFLYVFMNFFQPGIFWTQLADFKPMLVLSMLAIVGSLPKKSVYARREAFQHPIFVWISLFFLIQVLSLYSSGLSAMLSGFSTWLVFFVFVATSVLLVSNNVALSRYVWGMMAGGMFIVIFGILAVLLGWPQALGGRAGAYGMYENHNDYSFIVIQIVPFLYMMRTITRNTIARMLLAASLGACVIGILLSLSRGGILALVLEFALIILFGMTGRKRWLWVPVLVVVGVAAIGFQWAKRAENQGSNYTAADAENSRFELWDAAVNMIMAKPILGVGTSMFYDHAQEYGEISHDNRGKNTHNTYLEILTGTGLLGFFAFYKFISRLLRALHRPFLPCGPPLLDAVRRATLIAVYSMLMRATLDAKVQDWSFYILATIGLVCVMLQRAAEAREKKSAAGVAAIPAGAAPMMHAGLR
jgi:hypothetical protein